jgi:hypothetical protein
VRADLGSAVVLAETVDAAGCPGARARTSRPRHSQRRLRELTLRPERDAARHERSQRTAPGGRKVVRQLGRMFTLVWKKFSGDRYPIRWTFPADCASAASGARHMTASEHDREPDPPHEHLGVGWVGVQQRHTSGRAERLPGLALELPGSASRKDTFSLSARP